jgi:hypothetical protein
MGPNGSAKTQAQASHPGRFGRYGHRDVAEDVLCSAEQDALSENSLAEFSQLEPGLGVDQRMNARVTVSSLQQPDLNPKFARDRLARMQDKLSHFAAAEPLRASALAFGTGALLGLVIARGIKRLVAKLGRR